MGAFILCKDCVPENLVQFKVYRFRIIYLRIYSKLDVYSDG